MNQTETFLSETMPRLRQAEVDLHNGDPEPRIRLWSHTDQVTLFGGVMGGSGWAEIEPIFQRLGASFSDCRSYDNQVIAARAGDDLAYTVAYEHTTASIGGGRHRRTCCASPRCSPARTVSGRWCTVTPTRLPHRPPASSSRSWPPARNPRGSHAPTEGQRVIGLFQV